MVKHRNLISFIATVLLYLFLFGIYFSLLHTHVFRDQKAQNTMIQLSLTEFVPEIVPLSEEEVVVEESQDEEVVEEEVEEKVQEVEPEPVPKEVPVEEIIPPKPLAPKIIPKPVLKKEILKKKKVKKKKKHKKKHKKKKKVKIRSAVSTNRGVKKQGSGHTSTVQKNRFLARVRQRINRNKSYPKAAKKRGIQGSVKVRFTILRNGKVSHVSVVGPKVFHSSARRAVEKSFPIRTKNIQVSLPKTVNLTLRYQLR